MLRLTLAALLCAATTLPAAAQDKIENEQMVIYNGQWVQSKLPEQAGALMFLTLPRGQKGEYFTISCTRSGGAMDRTVKLGFPEPLAQDGMPVTLTIDGQPRRATASFTGTTRDDAYTKSDIHSYALTFENDAAEADFFNALAAGNTLEVSGQTVPVSLTGVTAGLNGQEQYCQ